MPATSPRPRGCRRSSTSSCRGRRRWLFNFSIWKVTLSVFSEGGVERLTAVAQQHPVGTSPAPDGRRPGGPGRGPGGRWCCCPSYSLSDVPRPAGRSGTGTARPSSAGCRRGRSCTAGRISRRSRCRRGSRPGSSPWATGATSDPPKQGETTEVLGAALDIVGQHRGAVDGDRDNGPWNCTPPSVAYRKPEVDLLSLVRGQVPATSGPTGRCWCRRTRLDLGPGAAAVQPRTSPVVVALLNVVPDPRGDARRR